MGIKIQMFENQEILLQENVFKAQIFESQEILKKGSTNTLNSAPIPHYTLNCPSDDKSEVRSLRFCYSRTVLQMQMLSSLVWKKRYTVDYRYYLANGKGQGGDLLGCRDLDPSPTSEGEKLIMWQRSS